MSDKDVSARTRSHMCINGVPLSLHIVLLLHEKMDVTSKNDAVNSRGKKSSSLYSATQNNKLNSIYSIYSENL